MKRLVKTTSILLMMLTIINIMMPIFNATYAFTPSNVTPTKPDGNAGTAINNAGSTILSIIQVVGTIMAVGILMVIGIKYMMGSAEERAEYKKTMLPYVIGAILLFAAVNLARYIITLAESFNVK